MPPDGYTRVLGVSSYVVMAPGIYPKLAYDPNRDFAPPTLIGRIDGDVARAGRLPDLQERFAAEGGEIVAGTPEKFGAFIARDLVKWTKVAREAGAEVD